MKKEFKLEELLVIQRKAEELIKLKFPPKSSFKIAKILASIRKEVEIYDEERRKIITNLCEKGDNGEPIVDERGNAKIPPENREALTKDLTELNLVEVSLDYPELSINDFDNCDNISVEQMMVLEKFIKE